MRTTLINDMLWFSGGIIIGILMQANVPKSQELPPKSLQEVKVVETGGDYPPSTLIEDTVTKERRRVKGIYGEAGEIFKLRTDLE